MSTPLDLSQIPKDFDSIIALARAIAGPKQVELLCEDARLANYPSFHVALRLQPDSTDAFTNRLSLTFNEDNAAVYEASHRAFLTVSDSPGATESPTIEHVKERGRLHLVPNLSDFYTGSADVFEAHVVALQQDAKEQYRILCHWSLGESVSGGTNKHPRWGFMTGHYCGSTAGKAISKVVARFGNYGRLAQGSLMTVYGTESALFSRSWVYDLDESWSTSEVWRPAPTDKAMFRRVMKLEGLPAPGAAEVYALPDTNLSVRTARIQEVWIVKESTGESEDPANQLSFKITGTQLAVTAPSGAFDFSGYDYAYVVLHFARP